MLWGGKITLADSNFCRDLLPQRSFVLIGFYCSAKCSLDQKVAPLVQATTRFFSYYSNDENMNNFITEIHSYTKVSAVIPTMFGDVFDGQCCSDYGFKDSRIYEDRIP